MTRSNIIAVAAPMVMLAFGSATATAQELAPAGTLIQGGSSAIQSTTAVQAPIVALRPSQAVAQIPAGYEITVTPMSDFSSKGAKVGHTFTVQTVYDVMYNGYVVIPRGTLGQARVAWRTGKGIFGKSAKMEIAFDWIDVGGRHIGLNGKYRQDGSGNTAVTGGVAAAGIATGVGILGGFFITGKSAVIARGAQMAAYTMESIPVALPGDENSSGIQPIVKTPLPAVRQ